MGKSALNVSTTEFTLGGTLEVTPANASAVPAGKTVYCGFASCVASVVLPSLEPRADPRPPSRACSGLDAAFTEWNDGSCPIPTENITVGQTYGALACSLAPSRPQR